MNKPLLIAFPVLLLFIYCSKSGGSKPPGQPASEATINMAVTHQIIQGFGGATVFRPDLSDGDISTLFGNDNNNQLGLNILRIRVNPFGPGEWATELSNAKRVAALGAIVMATPWSPPAAMKTNSNTTGGSLKSSSYADYADYLESFADYMSTNGAPLYALSIQNEPDIKVNYESCDWTAQEMTDYIRNNTFNLGSTKLMAAESFQFRHPFTDTILNDVSAASKIQIIGGHIYGGGLKKYDNALNKGKEVWMTEHLDTLTTWTAVMATAKEIHDCLAVANFSAYLWWYLKRFYGPINESGQITKRGYVMAQFSKYIRHGYQRIETSSPYADVQISAYKGNGKLVIVAINSSNSEKNTKFSISGGTVPDSFTPYFTTQTKNLTTESVINSNDSSFTYKLLPSSITTFVSN